MDFFRERRDARRAVRAGRPLTHREFRVVTGAVAALETSGRWSIWLWPVLTFLFVADALAKDGWQRWLMLAVAAMYGLLWPWLLRLRTRTLQRYQEALSRRSAA